MNRKEFYAQYREARFLFTAFTLRSIDGKVVEPKGGLISGVFDLLSKPAHYAIMNRYKSTHYPIAENKWAIKNNTKF